MRRLACLLALFPAAAAAQTASPEVLGVDTQPPLSLADAEILTNRAQLLLEGYGSTNRAEDLRLARLMLQCVTDYVQLADQRRSTLTEYTFTWLGKDAIGATGASVEITLDAEEPIPHVQALALVCSRDLVEVLHVSVEAADGSRVERPISLRLDPQIPGRSFLYLPQMVDVAAVTLTVQTESVLRPRVKVWVGQTEQAEHLREALAHLGEARAALDAENRDRAAAEMDLARQLIGQSEEIATP